MTILTGMIMAVVGIVLIIILFSTKTAFERIFNKMKEMEYDMMEKVETINEKIGDTLLDEKQKDTEQKEEGEGLSEKEDSSHPLSYKFFSEYFLDEDLEDILNEEMIVCPVCGRKERWTEMLRSTEVKRKSEETGYNSLTIDKLYCEGCRTEFIVPFRAGESARDEVFDRDERLPIKIKSIDYKRVFKSILRSMMNLVEERMLLLKEIRNRESLGSVNMEIDEEKNVEMIEKLSKVRKKLTEEFYDSEDNDE